jgi:hypothetical protein
MLIRVNFQFPNHSELRYVEEVPMRGSSVRSQGASWVVAEVEEDVTGSYSLRLVSTHERDSRRTA